MADERMPSHELRARAQELRRFAAQAIVSAERLEAKADVALAAELERSLELNEQQFTPGSSRT